MVRFIFPSLIDLFGEMWYNRAVRGSVFAPKKRMVRFIFPSPIDLFGEMWYNKAGDSA